MSKVLNRVVLMSSTTGLRGVGLWPTATERFLAEQAGSIRTLDSRKSYTAVLRGLQNAHPDRRVSEFTEDDLVAYCTAVRRDGAVRSPNGILQRRTILISFFEWAQWRQLCPGSPAVGLKKIVKVKARAVRPAHWLTPAQLAAVLAACDDGTVLGKRDRILILTAGNTGLRRRELAELRWGKVDLSGRQISLVGKGGKPAVLGLPSGLAEPLFVWRGECAVGLGRPPAASDPVFPAVRSTNDFGEGPSFTVHVEWSKPLGVNGVWSAVSRRGALAGVAGLSTHDLRRTFAGMAEGQFDLLTTSAMLRHENVGTTQRYLEKNPRRAVEAGHNFNIAL